MPQDLSPGDFLVFQLEAGFALLRFLAKDASEQQNIWHVRGYDEFFPDVETAETATSEPDALSVNVLHAALTDRAFASTQVARISNKPLKAEEIAVVEAWRADPARVVSDRSIRLLMGLR